MPMHTAHAIEQITFGPVTKGSSNIQPHRHHNADEPRFAVTMGPGIELLSLARITAGIVVSSATAPMKLENEEIKPVRKSDRSDGSTAKEHAWNSANIPAALKYKPSICSAP